MKKTEFTEQQLSEEYSFEEYYKYYARFRSESGNVVSFTCHYRSELKAKMKLSELLNQVDDNLTFNNIDILD